MGSGKTTMGSRLAKKLGYKHIDTDEAIERLTGDTVSNIFSQMGEEVFRTYEQKITALTNQLDKVVISTGGGLPIYQNNMKNLLSSGITIYMETPVDFIIQRIKKDGDTRPILKKYTGDDLEDFIADHINEREKIYQEAHLSENYRMPSSSLLSHSQKELPSRYLIQHYNYSLAL